MTKKIFFLALLAACFSITSYAQKSSIRVQISTDSGTIVVKLYDETPLHRDNFIKLVRQGFYDSLLFHRVIPEFMIQGGDPTSKNAQPGTMLGGGGGNMERIPAEFHPNLYHKKGALAAARDNNPAKASSACQFYLVQGKKFTDGELSMIATRTGKTFSDEQRKMYTTVGGTPFLDQDYTVFGEIESGLEVVDKIVSAQKDGANRPLTDIRMQITELP
ncbi:MAG: peptidylprolyl isomerase [Ferruginibacter sp.]|nr:peptidylprolyl isomerase [Ferruginibacter sp.]